MAYTYQDLQLTTGSLSNTVDLTATSTHLYFTHASYGTDIVQTDHSLGNADVNFLALPSNIQARGITNDETHLYLATYNRTTTTRVYKKYLISTGALITEWTASVGGQDLLCYNSDNDQIYSFTFSSRNGIYNRYSNTGTLLGSHTLANFPGVHAVTYDTNTNRIYGSSRTRGGTISAFSVNADHSISLDTSRNIASPSSFRNYSGIANYNYTLWSRGQNASNAQALGRYTEPIPPTVSTPIPDQTLRATRTITINLANHFAGTSPTYSITSTSRSWITISGSTLTIVPTASEVSSTAYTVTVQATNTSGNISDSFDVTVQEAPASPTVSTVTVSYTHLTLPTIYSV